MQTKREAYPELFPEKKGWLCSQGTNPDYRARPVHMKGICEQCDKKAKCREVKDGKPVPVR